MEVVERDEVIDDSTLGDYEITQGQSYRYQDDRVDMCYNQQGCMVSWMLWMMCLEWVLMSMLWVMLVQILGYPRIDILGQGGECGAVRGGGTQTAANAVPVYESNAHNESETMILDGRDSFSQSFKEEEVDCESRIQDDNGSELELSEPPVDQSYQ